MTEKQKVEVRLSEVKKGLNELGSKTELNDDDKTEFEKYKTEYGTLEVRYQALTLSEPEPEKVDTTLTPEQREKRQLIDRCNIGKIFSGALEHRASEGPESELQAEYGLEGNMIPYELMETRAVTPAPGEVQQNQDAILMPVFANTAADFLGIDMPTIARGDAVYPVMTTKPSVKGPFSDSTSADETTGSFSTSVLSPERIQASFFWKRVDAARFAGMEESLRMALTEALGEKVDYEILRGSNGLLNGTNLADHDSTALANYIEYVTQLAFGRVDGRYATGTDQVKSVVGSAIFSHMSNQFRATESDRSALDRLVDASGGIRVSAHVAAPGASKKQLSVSRIGSHGRAAVAPIWNGIEIIPDAISKAASGEIKVTAVMLFNFAIARSADFRKQQFQIKA